MNTVERQTVSIPRACELVSVSRRTIYNWMASGKVQYVRTAGGSVRIFADTLWRGPELSPADTWTDEPLRRGAQVPDPDLTTLFHQLNNQLGVILANAELLEHRLTDEGHKARAGQVVAGALEAIGTAKRIRQATVATEKA